MSAVEKALGLIKSTLLMNEKFDALEADVKGMGADLAALGRSHAELAQRVARIEGMIEGAAMASSPQPRLPKD